MVKRRTAENLVDESVEQSLSNSVDVLCTSFDFAAKILDSDQLTARPDRTVTAKAKACVHSGSTNNSQQYRVTTTQ